MKAAWYESIGKASDVLTVGEMETPPAEPGGVRVRLHASGVNPSDVRARAGVRVDAKRMSFPRIIPHSDGPGKGSRFTVSLPLRHAGARQRTQIAA